ncbi:unnamed protein product [Aureobasidium vineae]|uniref:Uncharacterized protein n=1 Tax=Aureobasidium vineae TaxID=2773715 RepID=A0A9N8PA95_9PEZI|nr:unnamed protein product [Aureobasidium vineae]
MRFLFLLCSLLYVARAENRCYNTQGTLIAESSYVPCNSTAAICIQGGLCYATQSSYNGYIYGNGCTDSTFSDASCPYACPMASKQTPIIPCPSAFSDERQKEANGWKSYNVLPCTRDKWCCRDALDSSNCCNNSTLLLDSDQTSYLGRSINNVIPGTSTSTSDSNSTEATATVTSTITATSSSDSDSSNTTTVVGAAVGAVLGMGALKSQESYSNASSSAPMVQQHYSSAPLSEAPSQHAYEADWNNGRYEIDSTGK